MIRKTVLVTGANSGLGWETARLLLVEGCAVYAGDVKTDKIAELEGLGGKTLFIDVTDGKSVREAVETMVIAEGRIDVLVNNAGVAFFSNIENYDLERARQMFDVNFFGYARMIQNVLPFMRKQRKGLIINVGSGSGHYTTPLCGYYCATKYAVEALSDALRQETGPFGISVSLIEPGYFKSGINESILAGINGTAYSEDYKPLFQGFKEAFPRMWESGAQCDTVAAAIVEAVSSETPQARYYPVESVIRTKQLKSSLSDEEFDALMLQDIGF